MKLPCNSSGAQARVASAILVALALLLARPLHADQTSAPDGDAQAQLERQKQEIERLKLEKEIAELKEAIRKASIPASDVKALSGSTTINDGVEIEVHILSYRAMDAIAAEIARRIAAMSQAPGSLVVATDPAIDIKVDLYRVLTRQLAELEKRYDEILHPKAPKFLALDFAAPVTVATGSLKAVLDLVSLFRSEVDIKGKTVTLDDVALVAQLAKHAGRPVYYPKLLLTTEGSELGKSIAAVGVLRWEAEREIARINADAQSTPQEKQAALALAKMNAAYDAMLAELNKADAASGSTVLAALLRAEHVAKLIDAGAGLLHLKVLKGGGNNRTKKNLFTGSSLSHSGGAIVSFILFAKDGAIRLSDTLDYYDGYRKVVTRRDPIANRFEPGRQPSEGGSAAGAKSGSP